LVGGLIDLFVGSSILQQNSMMTNGLMMISAYSTLAGYLLLGLGVIVLLTGLYVVVSRMMKHRSTIALLMIVYGVIVLVLGVGMIAQFFNLMMQGSSASGIAMIIVGLAMLYSGSGMTKTPKGKMM
jgi:uncharacterized membrane protein HdeD (DUF308 family)